MRMTSSFRQLYPVVNSTLDQNTPLQYVPKGDDDGGDGGDDE